MERMILISETELEQIILRIFSEQSHFRKELQERSLPLLGAGAAASMLSIHPVTLKKWSDQGMIPSITIGKRRKYKREDVDKLIEKLRKESTERIQISN